MSQLVTKITQRRRASESYLRTAKAPGLLWGQCGLVPTTSLYRCTRLFAKGLDTLALTADGRPRLATLAALENFFEALVFCELIAVKDPTVVLEEVTAETLRDFEWTEPALDSILFVPFDWKAASRDNLLSSLESVVMMVTPEDIAAREREAYPVADFVEGVVFFLTLDGMGAFGKGAEDYAEDVLPPGVSERWEALNDAGGSATLELMDLALARLICDDKEMTLWAVPETAYFHLFSVTHAPIAVTALAQMRDDILRLRRSLLGGRAQDFQLAGDNLHCNVQMSPVLLALIREASSSHDLIHLALQFRAAGDPFRRHLALLDGYSEQDLLRLADWRHELQSISAAVAKSLGLSLPGEPGNIGSAVLQFARGDPAELLRILVERAPPRLRRHLLHPIYLGRRKTFVRNLVYDSLLAPEPERKLLKLFRG